MPLLSQRRTRIFFQLLSAQLCDQYWSMLRVLKLYLWGGSSWMAWAWDGSNRKCCHDSRKSYTNPMINAYTYLYVYKYMRLLVIILNVRIPYMIYVYSIQLPFLCISLWSLVVWQLQGPRVSEFASNSVQVVYSSGGILPFKDDLDSYYKLAKSIQVNQSAVICCSTVNPMHHRGAKPWGSSSVYSNSDQILVGISKKQGSPEALQNAGGKGCSKEVSVGHLRWRTAYHAS